MECEKKTCLFDKYSGEDEFASPYFLLFFHLIMVRRSG